MARIKDNRCTTCHRDAHRPGTGWQGHDYAGPAGEAEPGREDPPNTRGR